MSERKAMPVFVPDPQYPTDMPLGAEDFAHVGAQADKQNVISRPSISYWQDAMRRFLQNKTSVVCMFILAFIVLMAIFTPLLSPYDMSEVHIQHTHESLFYTDPVDGHMHVFGTDSLGRDIFTRVWYGARTSLFIAISAVLLNVIIGVTYGSFSAYIGGGVDNLMMRFVEVISAIPYMIIVILFTMMLGRGVFPFIIAYAAIGWVSSARLSRGQILSLKTQEFIIAGRALGAGAGRIIARHMVPNILSVIIVNLTLAIPSAIFTEAFLSYIGMGVPVPEASWGNMAQEGVLVFQMFPGELFIPAFFISITMLAFNLLGDGLRDALDPRLRR